MEIQKIALLLIMVTFFGCFNKNDQGGQKEEQTISNISSLAYERSAEIATNWQLSDTLIEVELINETYLNYDFYEGFYKIEWGNEKVKNISKQKFEIQGSGNLQLLDFDENTILLSQGCGTSCSYYVVLQIVSNADEKLYYYAKTYDLAKNLIAFIPENSSSLRVRIENFNSGEKQDFFEENHCPAAFPGDCIDSCYFDGNSLILKWQGSDWNNTSDDIQVSSVKISI